MFRKSTIFLACALALAFSIQQTWARGGRGGGGGGGGHMGGGGGGGRVGGGVPSAGSGMSRSPSMSHMPSSRPTPQPSVARPAQRPTAGLPASRPAQRPNAGLPATRPATSGAARSGLAGAAGGQAGVRAPSNFQRPSQDQLGSFLNMPLNSGARAGEKTGAGARASSFSEGATQLPSDGGPRSFTTERGTTITVGGRGGSTEVGGGTVAGGVGGIKIETAGGATYGKVGGAVGVSDGSNAAIRGGSVSGAQGARGSIVNVSRGYADTAGNVARGSVTAAQNRFGYTAVNARGGVASGGVAQVGSVSAVRGPGGNVISGGRGATFVNGQFVGGQNWTAVNGAYTRWNVFTPGWYGQYPGCWWPGKWAVATTAWAAATWPYASAYCGCGGEPVYYDYGGNVAYDEETVYADDQPVATAQEYYDQAQSIANAGAEVANEDWLPLGVFAVIAEEEQTQTDKVVQLAINRDGIIRGNFQDLLTDKVTPVTGAVDKSTQRASMKLEGNDNLVVETGLYNLTNDEVPVLVHVGQDRREGRVLVRLKNPENGSQPASSQTK